MDTVSMVLYIIIVVCSIVVIFAIYKVVTIQIFYNKIKDRFTAYDGTLSLKNKDAVWKKYIKIVKAKNFYLGYEPEKLHYGSVSVGGVTSGGFYTTGGYNKVNATTNSGKYTMEFQGDPNITDNTIRRIALSEELYEEARKSNIAKYLSSSGHYIELFEKVERTKEETDELLRNARALAMGNPLTSGLAIDDKRGYPTYEKCKEILDWICDKY